MSKKNKCCDDEEIEIVDGNLLVQKNLLVQCNIILRGEIVDENGIPLILVGPTGPTGATGSVGPTGPAGSSGIVPVSLVTPCTVGTFFPEPGRFFFLGTGFPPCTSVTQGPSTTSPSLVAIGPFTPDGTYTIFNQSGVVLGIININNGMNFIVGAGTVFTFTVVAGVITTPPPV